MATKNESGGRGRNVTVPANCILDAEAKERALDDFLGAYLASGFGALPKREIDLLIFGMMFTTGMVADGDSDQKISRVLKITAAKVRSLRYERSLRISRAEADWVRKGLIEHLKNARIHAERGRPSVAMWIPDILLRKEIEDLIDPANGFPDYSFNKEVLVLHSPAFEQLLRHALPQENWARFEAAMRNDLPGDHSGASPSALLEIFLHASAKRAGEVAGEAIFGGIFAALLDGGAGKIAAWVKKAVDRMRPSE